MSLDDRLYALLQRLQSPRDGAARQTVVRDWRAFVEAAQHAGVDAWSTDPAARRQALTAYAELLKQELRAPNTIRQKLCHVAKFLTLVGGIDLRQADPRFWKGLLVQRELPPAAMGKPDTRLQLLVPRFPADHPMALAAANLARYIDRNMRAKPTNTVRNRVAAWEDYYHFALRAGAQPLSSQRGDMENLIADYVKHCRQIGKKAATIKNRLSHIRALVEVAEVPNPFSSRRFREEISDLLKNCDAAAGHVAPLRSSAISGVMNAQQHLLTTERLSTAEKALIRDILCVSLGWDLCARAEDLESLHLDWIDRATGLVTLFHGKTRQDGAPRSGLISGETMPWLTRYLAITGLTEGPLLRGFTRSGGLQPLTTDKRGRPRGYSTNSIRNSVKAVAALAGIDPATISGHSMRIGWQHDAETEQIDVASRMLAAGYRRPDMVAYYSVDVRLVDGGVGQLQRKLRR